jgi:hypothetical protein
LGLGLFENRRLPPSSRHDESGVWEGFYRLVVEMAWILRGATGGKRGPVRGITVNFLLNNYRVSSGRSRKRALIYNKRSFVLGVMRDGNGIRGVIMPSYIGMWVICECNTWPDDAITYRDVGDMAM